VYVGRVLRRGSLGFRKKKEEKSKEKRKKEKGRERKRGKVTSL